MVAPFCSFTRLRIFTHRAPQNGRRHILDAFVGTTMLQKFKAGLGGMTLTRYYHRVIINRKGRVENRNPS